MSQFSIKCPHIKDEVVLQSKKKVQISIVAIQYPCGIPARFCAGLVPAVVLSRQLASLGVTSIVRVMDPTPIASWCNGWALKESIFRGVVSNFMRDHGTDFFFDECEPMSEGAIEILHQVAQELTSSTDVAADAVSRTKQSAVTHGGESGARNHGLYTAAHPFSWLDMHHPLIWKKRYSPDELQFVNLMPGSESRYLTIRKFLQERRPDLSSGISSVECYMTGCNRAYYIPLEEKGAREPMFLDLENRGYTECHNLYKALKNVSSNHARVLKDFESLMSFVGLKV